LGKRHGESWAYSVLDAALNSPAWPRTLLIYTYDEHGGYYDHVKPPAAIAPDSIAPALGPEDVPGGYDIYGPRVPAVVVSPYSKPNAVDQPGARPHLGGVAIGQRRQVLATIEAKWNNAKTVEDFLDLKSAPALLEPPTLAEPPPPGPGTS
jgi:phospholipase C